MCLKSYGLGQDPPPPLRKNSITNLLFFSMASLTVWAWRRRKAVGGKGSLTE